MKESSREGGGARSGLSWEEEVIFNAQEEISIQFLAYVINILIQSNSIQVFIVQLLYAGHNAKSCLQ